MLKIFRLLCGPVSFAFALWFMFDVVPQLNAQTQNSINNGQLGALLGFFGFGIVYLCLTVSWDEVEKLFNHKKTT